MPKTIFVYSTHLNYTPHVETELELMQLHLDEGDKVYRFICNGHLSVCDMNQNHEMLYCLKCRDVRVAGGELLKGHVTNLPITKKQEVSLVDGIMNCKNTEELKNIYYQNFDVGYAIASTLISMYRNSDFDVSSKIKLISDYYISTVSLYLSVLDDIKIRKPDRVYIFNGRFTHVRAIMRACEATNTEFVIHERGCDKDHYDLFFNTMPHDRQYAIKNLDKYWANSKHSPEEKRTIASSFFESRMKGTPKDWISYIKNQDTDVLPDNFDRSKINVAIFNSSIDEFAAISKEWVYPFYDNQEEFIEKFMNLFKDDEQFHFYLRVHPNLKKLQNSQIERIEKLRFKNLTVIPADSKIGSYSVMNQCNKILTFGSTMGIEAAYWNKPSILVASGFYNDESVYIASSYEEAYSLIKSDLKPKSNLGALKYGYYHSVKGIKFKYFKADSLFKGTFKDVNIMAANSVLRKMVSKIYLIKFIGKPIALYDKYYKSKKLKLPLN